MLTIQQYKSAIRWRVDLFNERIVDWVVIYYWAVRSIKE